MIKLYLSPSTQEKNIGYNDYGTEEDRMNILASIIENNLRNYNIQIKRNNPNWKLSEVIEDSNNFLPYLHLSLHTNANDRKTRGSEVFCHEFDTTSHEFAKIIYKNLEKITPSEDRGVKEGFNFYGPNKHILELYKTLSPAVLVEIAFHDNKYDATWIINNLQLIADNITDSILEILQLEKIIETKEKFEDIADHWAKENIIQAYNLGLVQGYSNNLFHPDKSITRAEATTIILNLYKKIKEDD